MNSARHAKSLSSLACAGLAILSLGHAGNAEAAVVPVSNCLDHGTGSLRNAVSIAASGDTVDLQSLGCSLITLSSGEIVVRQANLALIGRGSTLLTIDGNRTGRIFSHTGTGTLRISSMSMTRGVVNSQQPVSGGCIRSAGNVELRHARVFSCFVNSFNPGSTANSGSGGGIAARNVLLSYSSVYNNGGSGYGGAGGGVVTGLLTLDHAGLYGNSNSWGGGAQAAQVRAAYSIIRDNTGFHGGGLLVGEGAAVIRKSTISGNSASECGAGLCVESTVQSQIIDSTISSNTTGDYAVAGAEFTGSVAVYNSTIASNRSGYLRCVGFLAHALHAESTIIANNTCMASGGADLGGESIDADSIVGSHNLIGKSTLQLPLGTLRTNPRLGALVYNGGPTPTHALLSDSPAIGRGNNVLGLAYDQRGPGYPRQVGHCVDIGAFERH